MSPLVFTERLADIHCEFNYLTSTIPSQISRIANMRILDFSGNDLTGSIPADFFPTLIPNEYHIWEFVYLFSNNLVGTIPTTIGNLIDLRDLLLNDNHFTGTIPVSINNCTNLASLLLQNNKLEGYPDLPFRQNPESFYQLQTLDLSSNSFSGPIPAAFFRLPAIFYFASSQNCFHGELPEEICNSSTLEQLYLEGLRSGEQCKQRIFGSLSDVYLSEPLRGGIPACLWDMPSLRFLFLSGNLLTGTFPVQVEQNLSSLQYIGGCNKEIFYIT